ncbi:MAG: sugar phosphate isomerase/epimerase [Blastocatellia bacterium]|nr:sugar phosphate isomerase/epimerase [Blastocatellia bacterium]
MINRRRFLNQAACGAAGALAFAGMESRAANVAGRLSRIGVQLYTVRAEMAKDFEGSLKRVAEIGYKEVEFAGYFNRSAKDVRAILDRYGLTAPSAHVPLKDVQTNIDQAIETAKIIGHQFLICPYLEEKDRKSLDDYKRHAEAFNKAGAACGKAGLQFGYHNHDFEFKSFDGKLAFDQLLADTDKKLVKVELDLYWVSKAKQDPLAFMARHPGRFVLFHVKDMDKTEKAGMTEVGNGVIDFKTIFAKSKGPIKHYFVEQDICPGSPFDSLKTSFEYLKPLEF